MRGKIKQQIDPAFNVRKTDVQFLVSEEAVSKTAILNPHAPGFQTRTCSVITSGGEAGWGMLCCMSVLPSHGDFRTCHSAWIMSLITLCGRKAELGPKMRRLPVVCSFKSCSDACTLLLLSRWEIVMFSDMFLRGKKCFLN